MTTDFERESFGRRHIGPSESEQMEMLKALGFDSAKLLLEKAIPSQIRTRSESKLGSALTESESLAELAGLAAENDVFRSFIGMGYSDTLTPPVIQRNVLENPGWYTQYTPYQAEIAQGRLEALLNFQTMVTDLTGMEIANASLLDEATGAAEAMGMSYSLSRSQKNASERKRFFVSEFCHPQTLAVVETRAEPLGIEVVRGKAAEATLDETYFGALLQYPTTEGSVENYEAFTKKAHDLGILVSVATDLLALALLKPPGEWGADIVVGNTQRFGVPLGYGGPHAAFLATKDAYKRQIPGRIVGVSKDAEGRSAVRLALQTREQHIRRDRATSNICTAQVLLAIMASMYAVYHGPKGIQRMARRVHALTGLLAAGLKRLGYELAHERFFDTLKVQVKPGAMDSVLAAAKAQKMNLRQYGDGCLGVALDEVTTQKDVMDLLKAFASDHPVAFTLEALGKDAGESIPGELQRKSEILTHPVFNSYHSETEMLRYIKRLESKDLSLTVSMIPLGSCTMKLNATAEMYPVSWPGFSRMHPFVPQDQARGYRKMIDRLEQMLMDITGFDAISFQPNAGSQGEYAGLLVIRKYHQEKGQGERNVCLIPQSAHGTNPASAAMAGMKIVVVKCDSNGNIDVEDLKAKAKEHSEKLSALMVTYPSTHGVFEEAINEICEIVHGHGGQVYMDGANLNAQVGFSRPAEYGADVCHLNLHKTFCIPHGGGGPGMGPIGVKKHLASYLPGHPVIEMGGEKGIGAISSAPWGSPSILPISYAYIAMMGAEGLKKATEVAILSANYIAKKLDPHFPVLYKGKNSLVAHECIVDLRQLKPSTGVEVEDVAKRLMDYGYHAPTISFPVPGTMMIEPTESESKAELDRFCEAMISIRKEIAEIEEGKADKQNNVLKNAPHTATVITSDAWDRPYSREKAVYPAKWLKNYKFWPAVSRIDQVYGERNLVCACPPPEDWV